MDLMDGGIAPPTAPQPQQQSKKIQFKGEGAAGEAVCLLPENVKRCRRTPQLKPNLFRAVLMHYWGARCPIITGITDPALLRAPHIVPWAECGDVQRLD